jgi:hypothetical protein
LNDKQDYVAALVVEAVETVDDRRARDAGEVSQCEF